MDFLLILLAGLIAAVFVVGVAVVWPITALVVVLIITFFLPVEISTQLGSLPRIGPTRILVGIFLLSLFMRNLLIRKPLLIRPQRPPKGAILIYFVAIAISYAFSIDGLASTYFIIDQLVIIAFFFIFWRQFADEASWQFVKHGLYVGVAAVCLFACVEAVTGFNPIVQFVEVPRENLDVARLGIVRIRATFYHPIALGVFLNLVFPFVIVDLVRNDVGKRLVVIGLAGLMLVAQFLTVSRMPWMIMVLEAILVPMLWRPLSPMRVAMVAIAISTLIGVLVLSYMNVDFIEELFSPILNMDRVAESSSEYYRIALTKAVLNSLSGARWIYGFGPGTFHLAGIMSEYAGQMHVLDAPDLHYIRVLADTGIMGIATFAGLLVAVVSVCIRALRLSSLNCRPDTAACLASVLGFILVNATVSMFYTLPLVLLFWLAVARACALRDLSVHVRRASKAAGASISVSGEQMPLAIGSHVQPRRRGARKRL